MDSAAGGVILTDRVRDGSNSDCPASRWPPVGRLVESLLDRLVPVEPYHVWRVGSAHPHAEFFDLGSTQRLVRFPGRADFVLAADGSAKPRCRPVAGESGDEWVGLFEHQIIPLLMAAQGEAVFHGSAAVVNGGAAVFLGESGRGKSTLIAALARRDHLFLSDDLLHVRFGDDGVTSILPSFPQIRLWQDSMDSLASGVTLPVDTRRNRKPRIDVHSEDMRVAPTPFPLAKLYLLGEDSDEVRIHNLSASQSFGAWVANQFVLDSRPATTQKQRFEWAVRLAGSAPAAILSFPRRFDSLDEVTAAIECDLAHG